MNKPLSHFDESGRASMVDVSAKPVTPRQAVAHAFVAMAREALDALPNNKKGDPLEISRIAGILAAKRTAELIPLCHPLPLTHIDVALRVESDGIDITATVATSAQTGVEMEALTAATVAALTVYDMTKAIDKAIEIRDVHLVSKLGGKSGNYQRQES